MNFRIVRIAIARAVMICGSASAVESGDVIGVFGLDRVTPETYLAMWIPTDGTRVITGVRWYQNDANIVMPRVLVYAGGRRWPRDLNNGVVVADSVSGGSLAWSEVVFSTPVTSNCGGLYVAFQIPEGSEYGHEGAGGGFGMGYLAGDGVRRCWLSGNGIDWNPMVSSVCLAVDPVLSTEKSGGNVLVLEASGVGPRSRQELRGESTANLGAYPNPFNPESTIAFDLPKSGAAEVEIFDVRGRKVRTLVSGILTAGPHTVQWDGSDDSGASVASGVYFVRLGSRGFDATRRIVLLK